MAAGILVQTPVFQWSVLALFFLYCLLVWAYRPFFPYITGFISNRATAGRIIDDQNSVFGGFLSLSIVIGIFLNALFAIRVIDFTLDPQISDWPPLLAVPGSVAIFVLVFLVQYFFIYLSGKLTRESTLTDQLIRIRALTLSVTMIYCTPFALLSLVTDGLFFYIFSLMSSLIFLCGFIVLIFRTKQAFEDKNVSILFWILYLCAVEIFPVSLIVVAAMRNF